MLLYDGEGELIYFTLAQSVFDVIFLCSISLTSGRDVGIFKVINSSRSPCYPRRSDVLIAAEWWINVVP